MDTSNLPLEFLDRMKVILKEEYDDFLLSYKKDTQKGLRINTLKIKDEKELPFSCALPPRSSLSSFEYFQLSVRTPLLRFVRA